MLDLAVITLLGVFSGVVTGLTPGLHPNTVIFMSLPLYFSTGISLPVFGCFISGLSVSHTFHDFIPALFLGLPESDTALSTVPGLEMVVNGKGLEAFNYSVYGGLYASIVFLLLTPIIFLYAEPVYSFLEPYMAFFLLFILLTVVFNTPKLWIGGSVAALSGILGLLAFEMPVNESYVFIPLFSGLFAVPILLSSLSSTREIPEQSHIEPLNQSAMRGGLIGFIAGAVAGIFPGIGSSISTSFLTPLMEDSEKEFIAGLGGVNTADILISFIALIAIGKSRSGASVALSMVSKVNLPRAALLMGSSMLAVGVSAPLALKSGAVFAELSAKFPRRPFLVASGVLVFVATVFLTGYLGVLVLFTSSAIGYVAMLLGDRRPCMSVLLVPAISFFAKNGIFI